MRMRYQLVIKNLFCSLLFFGLLSLQGVAFAQVYKSYDADGNVVFSDKPTQRSTEVELNEPNVSETFAIPPPPPAESSLETKPETESDPAPVTQPIADDDFADTNNDGRVSRREKEAQRKKKHEKAKAAKGDKE